VFDDTPRAGEDIILSNVLAFDVRVFDPAAPIGLSASGGTAIVPGDTGFSAGGSVSGSGAYVDLGHSATTNSLLNADPLFSAAKAVDVTNNKNLLRTYCTWSTHYEANGIDEDGIKEIDQGTDGLDSSTPPNSLVDESSEQETSPPYPYPLRGIEVRIRVYEPKSQQARQVSVRHTFVPH
jgi:hypothetical protein